MPRPESEACTQGRDAPEPVLVQCRHLLGRFPSDVYTSGQSTRVLLDTLCSKQNCLLSPPPQAFPSLPPLSFAPTIQPHRASSRVRRSRPLMITYQTLHHYISPWIVALLLAGRRSGCPAGCITHQTISPSSANLFSLSHKKATEPVQAVGLCLAKAVRS